MRVFVGIKLENNLKIKLLKIGEYLYQNGVRGNFTSKDNFHVTLSFIGEVNNEGIENIKKIIEEISLEKFDIEVVSIRKFKDYVICDINKCEALISLQKKLRNGLIESGFKVDMKEYMPHITVIREPIGIKEEYFNVLNKNIKIKNSVNKLTLFESKRINGALKYVELN